MKYYFSHSISTDKKKKSLFFRKKLEMSTMEFDSVKRLLDMHKIPYIVLELIFSSFKYEIIIDYKDFAKIKKYVLL